MTARTRISASAMAEVKSALGLYYEAVRNSDLSETSQATYVDMASRFMRWLNYDFEPGSRVAPYTLKKGKKDKLPNPTLTHLQCKKCGEMFEVEADRLTRRKGEAQCTHCGELENYAPA